MGFCIEVVTAWKDPSVDVLQMSEEQLEKEEKRVLSKIKDKEKKVAEGKKRNEENEKKKKVTTAGNEDGRVEQLATKWIEACQVIFFSAV